MTDYPERVAVEEGSGNVFADLGYENPDEALLKARLAYEISARIRSRRMTRAKAAKLLDIDQPKLSALVNGQISDFSVERLLRFLTALGEDVEIVVKEKPSERERGRLSVIFG